MNTQHAPRLAPGKEVYVQMIIIDGRKFRGPLRGTLMAIDGEQTIVHFRIPCNPDVCTSCGSPSSLSRNGVTGEVVCMRSGCGHNHGFEVASVDYLRPESLIPANEYQNILREAEWQEKVKLSRRELEWAKNGLDVLLKEGSQNGWKE